MAEQTKILKICNNVQNKITHFNPLSTIYIHKILNEQNTTKIVNMQKLAK